MVPIVSSDRIRIHAVYVIAEDGRTAYYRAFSNQAPTPHLVSAMLTAMQVFIKEVTGSYFTEVHAGPFSFVSEKAGPFSVVIVSEKSHKSLDRAKFLTLRFIRKYRSAIENWTGQTVEFADFDEDVEEVFGKLDDIRIDPINPLDVMTLLTIHEKYQPVVKYLLTKGEVSLDHIAIEFEDDRFILHGYLEELVKLGHVGRFIKEGNFWYFVV